MFRFVCPRIALAAVALAIIGAAASGPVHAASTIAPKAYSIDQLAALPPETKLTIHGKTVTLGAMRASHQALLARFQSVSSLKALLTFGPPQRVVAKGTGVSLQRPPIGGPAPASSAGPVMNHVPSSAPNGPIDYVAACVVHSVCVYIPPISSEFSYSNGASVFVNVDALLTASVCTQDGGVMESLQPGGSDAPMSVCAFSYPMTAKQSAFPGNPPAMQATAAQSCANSNFTTQVDPMGAAAITFNANTPSDQPIVCAIDLFIPSS